MQGTTEHTTHLHIPVEFTDFIDRYGLPVAMIALMVITVWKMARWGRPILERVAEKHVKLLDETTASVQANQICAQEIASLQRSTLDLLKSHDEKLDKYASRMDRMSG